MEKTLSGIFSVVLLCSLMCVFCVNAADKNDITDDEMIQVTEQMAIEVAEQFSGVSCLQGELDGRDPIKVYDMSNGAIGYIVKMYKENLPYGYVILDSTVDGIVCEYNYGENISSPYELALQQTNNKAISTNNSNGGCIYKFLQREENKCFVSIHRYS